MASINASLVSLQEKRVLQDVLLDLAALRAAHLLMSAKLDLDAGVTDTNYAALTNPAALVTTT